MSLTPPQSATLERSLDRIEQEVRDKIRETLPRPPDDRYEEATGDVHDFADEAAAATEEDFNHVLHERYLGELRRIEAVRVRIAGGNVDLCAECGEPIGYARLLAYPLATRCVECQELHEKRGLGNGDWGMGSG